MAGASPAMTTRWVMVSNGRSLWLRQDLLQVSEELLPAVLGALIVLRLIRPEARLLHAQFSSRSRRGERERHRALKTKGAPRVESVLFGSTTRT
jgi:hypothetical protein